MLLLEVTALAQKRWVVVPISAFAALDAELLFLEVTALAQYRRVVVPKISAFAAFDAELLFLEVTALAQQSAIPLNVGRRRCGGRLFFHLNLTKPVSFGIAFATDIPATRNTYPPYAPLRDTASIASVLPHIPSLSIHPKG